MSRAVKRADEAGRTRRGPMSIRIVMEQGATAAGVGAPRAVRRPDRDPTAGA